MSCNRKSKGNVYSGSLALILLLISFFPEQISAQTGSKFVQQLPAGIQPAGPTAKPWVFWYWMQSSVSREGITADLQAMKEAGIAGAFLAPIKGKTDPPLYLPATEQLSAEWWKMLRYTLDEAGRLGIKIAMFPNDGFATAGGPWITPELSMQKVVCSSVTTRGGKMFTDTLPTLPSYKGYYRNIAVLAFPALPGTGISTQTIKPKVTSSTGADASFLAVKGNKQNFTSSDPCWIQYEFAQPFTCRSVVIHVNNYNYQSERLIIEVSDNGRDFHRVERLQPPRAGWLDWDADVTHEITPVTARFFRFVYDREGSEPGAEDLDAAKWKQGLKIAGIELSSAPRIHQFEGKTGEVWRVSARTTTSQVPDSLAVPLSSIVDVTRYVDAKGILKWKVPAGKWTILRVGYTSTGHMNETAGAGKGLECDKFNPEAVKLQFDKWFGEALRVAGPELTSRVLSTFHVDSWESGSQNWSPVFSSEFRRRRGYDPVKYLPAMAGIPVQNADISERFLYDVRQTISELIADNFFGTLKQLAHEKGVNFTAEATAPVMTADGMQHFKEVDVPMGEFWLRSPSHDKPNDVRDAISGGHIYGKQVIMAEAFTEVRMNWLESPAMLKTLQDRNYAFGINRFVYHVFVHNPWPDRKPGMTLSDVGLLFQRDQTWWKPGKAWVEYAERCQNLLQQGKPVTDIAVFSGEEVPRRALLPDRVVSSLPGIFGKETVDSEEKRLSNVGLPMRQLPDGVNTSANMATPDNWTDPMHGYAYDSFNADALLHLASVKDGRIVLPGGASYGVLVLPGRHPMQPSARLMSAEVAEKILQLVKDGATVILGDRPAAVPGLNNYGEQDRKVRQIAEELWGGTFNDVNTSEGIIRMKTIGTGRVIAGPFTAGSFDGIGIPRDLILAAGHKGAGKMAWNHRSTGSTEIYFISNQDSVEKNLDASFRVQHKVPQLYDAVSGETFATTVWSAEGDRVRMPLKLAPNGSVFVIFNEAEIRPSAAIPFQKTSNWLSLKPLKTLAGPWTAKFDPAHGGPERKVSFPVLNDWSKNLDSLIRYYSGTASYNSTFRLDKVEKGRRVWLELGRVGDIAEVKVNGVSCGTAWTAPFRLEITGALKKGNNELEINVTNTWANRLIGDLNLPEDKRIAHTTATIRLQGKPLAPAGLLGPVMLMTE